MRILYVHNFYQQPGGEDEVFLAESEMLDRNKNDVIKYTVSNTDVSGAARLMLAATTLWNPIHYRQLRELIRRDKPDVMHVHNTLPLLSPSVYYAAAAENIPVVQTAHNYRPFCLNGVLYRDGHVCEDCKGRAPLPGVIHKCYRNSYSASVAVFSLYFAHYRLFRTYDRMINSYIASTEFTRNLLVEMGLPKEKIVVKPNFIRIANSSHLINYEPQPGAAIVYVGRLDVRKGVMTLLSAMEQVNVPLVLIGDGDLRPDIEKWIQNHPNANVELTGWLNSAQVLKRLQNAQLLVLPSEFYESFGNVIVEAFVCGIPVVTTNIGAQAELVTHGKNGFLFPPGDSASLARIIKKVIDSPKLREQLGKNARAEFEAKYTVNRHYQMLLDVYQKTISGFSYSGK